MIVKEVLLKKDGVTKIPVPLDSVVLSVQVQNGDPVLYLNINSYEVHGYITITSVLTGGHPPDYGKYIGTAMLQDGRHVVHYFQGA